MIYVSHSKQAPLENFACNGTANTENDFFFVKPGASRAVSMLSVKVQGKGAALTALSGISIRMKTWTSTASTSVNGTSTTPAPKNKVLPAAVATAGMATVTTANTITSGTGGPNIVGYASMGASGPGGSVPINPDDAPSVDGGTTMSIDLFSSSPTVSLLYEFESDILE